MGIRKSTGLITSLGVWLLTGGVAAAQVGGGGLGFGAGGGFGGGGMNLPDRDTQERRQLLSPGAKDEWPVQLKAGEVVIVSIKSQAFDPLTRVLAPEGRQVAENDDIRPGTQDALLLYRAPRAGQYKILVTGARETAGGAYTLSLRRFVPHDVTLGTPTTLPPSNSDVLWFRVPLAARQTLALTFPVAGPAHVTCNAPNGEPIPFGNLTLSADRNHRTLLRTSTGEADDLPETGQSPFRCVLADRAAGDYYFRLRWFGGSPTVRAVPATVRLTRPDGETASQALAAHGLDLWRIPATRGMFLHLRAHCGDAPLMVRLGFPSVPGVAGANRTLDAEAPRRWSGLVELPTDPKRPGDFAALIQRTGTCEVEVYQLAGRAVNYTLRTSTQVPELPVGADIPGTLALGTSQYYALTGTGGDPVRLEAESAQFDPELELYNPGGAVVTDSDDADHTNRGSVLVALLGVTGRYLVRVHAVGDGGSGAYRLRRLAVPEKVLVVGRSTPGRVDSSGADIWTVNGRAGQELLVYLRTEERTVRARLVGPKGEILLPNFGNARGTEEGVVVGAVRLPSTGRYRLWVEAQQRPAPYTVRLFEVE